MDDTTGAPGAGPEPEPTPAPTSAPVSGPAAEEPLGFVASALTPIAPVHPAGDADEENAGSSAAFHAQDGQEAGQSGDAHSGSVLRALALAAVERWRKGAGANVKALEVEKAKAQARQIRTNHTISENRVGGQGGCKFRGGEGWPGCRRLGWIAGQARVS
ncbi:hypothetical protein OHB41_51405 [Streptomyces sp. NBC_01571]|uniref:hypothetical protein n=1 Tax=Streptomyces sp. NBC_01571 TaxID=2975883 RepID=UPI00225827A0|nr:hypothetical protein [Streptomyces sp. NBC_01571]MCX4581367.1 hypothetical protein [Streptomyces sp. NBC_01571]